MQELALSIIYWAVGLTESYWGWFEGVYWDVVVAVAVVSLLFVGVIITCSNYNFDDKFCCGAGIIFGGAAIGFSWGVIPVVLLWLTLASIIPLTGIVMANAVKYAVKKSTETQVPTARVVRK